MQRTHINIIKIISFTTAIHTYINYFIILTICKSTHCITDASRFPSISIFTCLQLIYFFLPVYSTKICFVCRSAPLLKKWRTCTYHRAYHFYTGIPHTIFIIIVGFCRQGYIYKPVWQQEFFHPIHIHLAQVYHCVHNITGKQQSWLSCCILCRGKIGFFSCPSLSLFENGRGSFFCWEKGWILVRFSPHFASCLRVCVKMRKVFL